MRRLILAVIVIVLCVVMVGFGSREWKKSEGNPPLLNPFIKIISLTTPTPTVKPSIKTTLLITGDVMLGRSVNTQTIRSGDMYFSFRKTQDLLRSADITLINLEAPLIDPCPNTDTGMVFCAPSSAVRALSWAGVDVANIANNHINNYKDQGYRSTIQILDDNHIFPSDTEHFILFSKDNLTFGFVGFDLVGKQWKIDELEKIIKRAKSQCDVLVTSFHWGQEYRQEQTDQQVQFGHAAVDSGADVVVGTHPHVIEPVENYKGIPIFYSLGNFVFDQMWSEETKTGMVGLVTFTDKKVTQVETVPIYITDFGQAQVYGSIKTNNLWP